MPITPSIRCRCLHKLKASFVFGSSISVVSSTPAILGSLKNAIASARTSSTPPINKYGSFTVAACCNRYACKAAALNCHLHRTQCRCAENQETAKIRRNKRSQGVKRLCEIQPARSCLRRSENRHIRVRGDLQGRHPRSDYHERGKKKGERWQAGSRNKQQRPQCHNKEAGDHCALIANPLHHLPRWHREYEIAGEKRKLHQHHFCVIQIEDRLEVGNQNVIQAGHEAPHKKQRRHHGHCGLVAGSGSRSLRAYRFACVRNGHGLLFSNAKRPPDNFRSPQSRSSQPAAPAPESTDSRRVFPRPSTL